jgi:hypothetical protein
VLQVSPKPSSLVSNWALVGIDRQLENDMTKEEL